MIRKRVSDKEEIVELQRKVNELEKQIAILPKSNQDLSGREKVTLEYIEDHAGTTKQAVIEALTNDSKGSRVTILHAINSLKDYGMILARKDKPNSPAYKLYINEDSIFLSVYRELENFQNTFSILVERIKTELLKENGESCSFDASHNSAVLYDLLLICHHVLGTYLTFSMLKWPAEIDDEMILTKINAIMIYRLAEIHTKLSKAFKVQRGMPVFDDGPTVGQVSNPILQEFIYHMFLLEPKIMVNILEDYKRYNMQQGVAPLLKIAWEIGFPIYPYTDLSISKDLLPHDMNRLKDWRYAIAYYLCRNKDIHVDREIWNMLGSPSTTD
jgi:hypothetical protein